MIQSIETVTFVRVEYTHPRNNRSDEYRIYPDGRVSTPHDDGDRDIFVCEGTITFIRELQTAAYPGIVFENKFWSTFTE